MIAAGGWALLLGWPRMTGGIWVCPSCGSDWIYERAAPSGQQPAEQEIDFNDQGEPINTASSHPILICAECQEPVPNPVREENHG